MTLLTPQDMAQMMQMDVVHVRKLVRQPGFPPPAIDLSRKIRRWSRDSVENWVRTQEKRNG